jgi:hypothetical protein
MVERRAFHPGGWLAALVAAWLAAAPVAADRPAIVLGRQGVLYTGGQVDGDRMAGQMHVFFQLPTRVAAGHYPIVFIHGSRLTGAGFLGSPEGRAGWATWFRSRGSPV